MRVNAVEMSIKNDVVSPHIALLLRGLSYDKIKRALDSGRMLAVIKDPNTQCLQEDWTTEKET